jgi:hypothetical protein
VSEPIRLVRKDGTTSTSWGDAKGASEHRENCACPRCLGFSEGNQLPTTHGAYSRLLVTERGEAIAEMLRADFPTAADELALRALGECVAQVQLAGQALSAVEELMNTPGRQAAARLKFLALSADQRAWVRELFRVLDRLGATPQARAEVAERLSRIDSRREIDADLDLDRLTVAERVELFRLLDRAKGQQT